MDNNNEEQRLSDWGDFDKVWNDETPQEESTNTEERNKVTIALDKKNVKKLLDAKRESTKEKIVKESIVEAQSLVDRIDEDIKKDTARNVLNYKSEIPEKEDIPEREYSEDETTDESKANIKVSIDPNTGEHKIINTEAVTVKDFDELVDDINSSDDYFNMSSNINEDDIKEYVTNPDDKGIVNNIGDFELAPENYGKIIEIIDRRAKRESFNTYKAMPAQVKKVIDDYIKTTPAAALPIKEVNRFRNELAESIIGEFVMNIQRRKSKEDFATNFEQLFSNTDKKYNSVDEKIEAYELMTDKVKDEAKKERLNTIIQVIKNARSLDGLNEFAKTCKIKKIEIEKYQSRVFNQFLDKYKNSEKNMYDINIALAVVTRHMLEYNCSFEDSIKFMIAFCKFVQNYSPDDFMQHTYMYYVIYYCAMLDGQEDKTFKDNIFKVISTLNRKEN